MTAKLDVKKVADQARTPFLAALGAGDLAAKVLADQVNKARDVVTKRAESAKNQVTDLPGDVQQLRGKLDPAELKKVVDQYTKAAGALYTYLAEHGEQTLEKLRTSPQVSKVVTQVEQGVEVAQEKVEEVRGLADDVLGKVTRRTKSTADTAAAKVTEAATDAAAKVSSVADTTADAAKEATDEAATKATKAATTVKKTAAKATTTTRRKPTTSA
ncbi:hypothetical protein D5S17_14025 [Pseudonocardiaceae bacterium YIM PH 21723]|nr:hypothetical protein D5S17_14025 [Pseudonocardiaceae bacterium YIM PH 21723]